MQRASHGWLAVAVSTGGVTWAVTHLLGHGPIHRDAWMLGCAAGLLVFGVRYLRLTPPKDESSRRDAVLGQGSKGLLLLILAGVGAGGGGRLFNEAHTGYPDLPADQVIAGDSIELGFYTASGQPLRLPEYEDAPTEPAFYRLEGPEGTRYLAPLDTYEGRLLVVTEQLPPDGAIRVTGRLREDLRTVQRSAGGPIPFLAEYRRLMGLPETVAIHFLDTSLRAGANVRTVVFFLLPAYLFLLVLGAPTRGFT